MHVEVMLQTSDVSLPMHDGMSAAAVIAESLALSLPTIWVHLACNKSACQLEGMLHGCKSAGHIRAGIACRHGEKLHLPRPCPHAFLRLGPSPASPGLQGVVRVILVFLWFNAHGVLNASNYDDITAIMVCPLGQAHIMVWVCSVPVLRVCEASLVQIHAI